MFWKKNDTLNSHHESTLNSRFSNLFQSACILHKSCATLTSRFDNVLEAQLIETGRIHHTTTYEEK